MEELKLSPIGIIHSPYTEAKGTPVQAGAAREIHGRIELFEEYSDGLSDLDGFSHIIILYYFHLSSEYSLKVVPFLDNQERGVFATRAPRRPNPIGFAVVEITEIKGNIIYFAGTDMIDGTPLLDIKPYVAEFDHREVTKSGWLEKNINKLPESKDDGRFVD